MPFAQIPNARMHYELSGPPQAPTLVFSNSLGSNLSMWDPQLSAFTEQFRILRYDTRGHGQSSVTPGPYSIELLAQDVLYLLDDLSLDRVYFCGLSMGGSTGMWLGVNAPERLHKLVLCNTSARIGTPEIWNPRIDQVRSGGLQAISTGVIGRWLTEAFRKASPDVAAATLRMLEATNPEGYVANCVAIRDFDAREAIASIHLPTLVVAGTHDVSTSASEGRYLARTIPGARYVELDAAHLSNLEQSLLFNNEVIDFLLSN